MENESMNLAGRPTPDARQRHLPGKTTQKNSWRWRWRITKNSDRLRPMVIYRRLGRRWKNRLKRASCDYLVIHYTLLPGVWYNRRPQVLFHSTYLTLKVFALCFTAITQWVLSTVYRSLWLTATTPTALFPWDYTIVGTRPDRRGGPTKSRPWALRIKRTGRGDIF